VLRLSKNKYYVWRHREDCYSGEYNPALFIGVGKLRPCVGKQGVRVANSVRHCCGTVTVGCVTDVHSLLNSKSNYMLSDEFIVRLRRLVWGQVYTNLNLK